MKIHLKNKYVLIQVFMLMIQQDEIIKNLDKTADELRKDTANKKIIIKKIDEYLKNRFILSYFCL